MKRELEVISQTRAEQRVWLKKLATIFSAMDDGYAQAAEYYGFACRGCEDSCCRTRFYHHTFLEYLYIYKGFELLTREERQNAKARAAEYCRKIGETETADTRARVMCPLNVEGLCTIYKFRPMICRLHGISHELHRPGQGILYGPGCDRFDIQREGKNDYPFDRTPFYKALAGLEKEFRQTLGVNEKIKMTIAEIIITPFLSHRLCR